MIRRCLAAVLLALLATTSRAEVVRYIPPPTVSAPTDATYLTQTCTTGLSGEQCLSALATGCLSSTTTTGVVATRTLTGTANEISVANGDCSAAPTFSLPATIDLGGKTSLEVPNGTGPTTDADGEIAFDINAQGAGRGSLQLWDGTANTYVVSILASDTCTNGQVPQWNTGGTWTCETVTGISGLTTGTIPKAASATTLGDSVLAITGGNVVQASGQLYEPNGSKSAPSYSFTGRAGDGFFSNNGAIALANAGSTVWAWHANESRIPSSLQLTWASGASPDTDNPDIGFKRLSAGIIKVTDGSSGDGNVSIASLIAATMTQETTGQLRTKTDSYTWTNAQVVALGAALTGDIGVATLPAKTVVVNAYVVITGQGAGATTFTVSCGRTSASYIDYIVASDAKAAANTVYGDASAERGTNLTGYDLPSYTGTTTINCHFVTTVQNLDQVTGSTGRVILTTTLVP